MAFSISARHQCNINFRLHFTSHARVVSIYRTLVRFRISSVAFHGYLAVNDNDELTSHANQLLVRMCGVTPPKPLINFILDTIFETIQTSPVSLVLSCIHYLLTCTGQSWKVRLRALPLLQGMLENFIRLHTLLN